MATLKRQGSITAFREHIRRARRRLVQSQVPLSEEAVREALEALGAKAQTAEGQRAVQQELAGADLSLGARFVIDTVLSDVRQRKPLELTHPLLAPPLPSKRHGEDEDGR